MIPIMSRLARATGYSTKRLLIPLSYMTILGGTMTLIGTSTNLIVDAVARKEGLPPFGIFDITPFGLVAAAAGAAVLIMFGPLLLPTGGAEALYWSPDEAEFLTDLLVHGDSYALVRALRALPLMKRSRVMSPAVTRCAPFPLSIFQNHIFDTVFL